MMRIRWVVLSFAILAAGCKGERARERSTMTLATTTSVADSGLLERLLPAFEREAKVRVVVRSVGSGKAIELLAAGEADVAITHAPEMEREGVASGKIARRTPFMRNDFVIVGPASEATVIAGAGDVKEALRRIAASGKKLVSRADRSGTHQREQALWRAAGVDPARLVIETKAGMGATLARASKERAFTLSDRSTFLAQRRALDLVILFQGDDELANEYSVLERDDGRKGRALRDFLRSAQGRQVIGSYGVSELGEPLFTPLE